MPRRRKYGFSFSWKRAVGISAFKGRLSRKIGIPLTRSGRQRKVGRMMGCCIPLALLVGSLAGLVAWGSVSLPLPRVPSRAEAQLQKDELQQPPDKPHFFSYSQTSSCRDAFLFSWPARSCKTLAGEANRIPIPGPIPA